MFNRIFSHIFDKAHRRKWLYVGIVAAMTVVSAISLTWIPFESDIAIMLPEDETIQRSIRFLRESNFSDKVVVSLGLTSDDASTQELIRAVDSLADRLGPPLITKKITGLPSSDVMEEIRGFLLYVPQLFGEEQLARVQQQFTKEAVDARLKGVYRQLLLPGGNFALPLSRLDPLGIGTEALRSIERLSAAQGYDVIIEQNHFVSRDRRHALLILQTPIPLTDGMGSKRLLAYLNETLKGLPESVSADLISGHAHTVSNEEVMRRDIRLTTILASAAFFLVFLLGFRDVRAGIIFLIPLISILISISLCALIVGKVSYFIVGMGGVITGISIDYGILVYITVRAEGGVNNVVKVARSVIVGALTTASAFAAFFLSSVRGYHDLALFSIISILFCLCCSLFILPFLLRSGQGECSVPSDVVSLPSKSFRRVWGRFIVGAWILLMLLGGVELGQVNFNSDVSQYDGSPGEVLQAEERFQQVWGSRGQPAMAVLQGENLEEVLDQNERLHAEAVSQVDSKEFASIASLWPSKATRRANADRWKQFWTPEKTAQFRELLVDSCRACGFKPDAFEPFFDNLVPGKDIDDDPSNLGILEHLKDRFIVKNRDGYQVISFFPDEDAYIEKLSEVVTRYSNAFVVSRKALTLALSRSVSFEMPLLACIAVISISCLTLLLLRNLRLTLLALAPVLTSIIVAFGVMPVLGLPLNVPCLIAGMVVVGLTSDYGIFMVYQCRQKEKIGISLAVTLCAITTLIGAGSLLFARHPVLFGIGLTLTTGILSGYLSALLVIPPLYDLFQPAGKDSHTQ